MSESRLERERWLLVKHLVADAAVLSPAERERFLTGECPDDLALGHEVEALLAAHDAAGEMFENRTWAVSDLAHAGLLPSSTAVYLEPGRRLGPYEIVAVIGAGGMGVVYRARDLRLDRMVALLCGTTSIRDVIAFPKTQKGQDLMAQSPTPVTAKQLKELHLQTVIPQE